MNNEINYYDIGVKQMDDVINEIKAQYELILNKYGIDAASEFLNGINDKKEELEEISNNTKTM